MPKLSASPDVKCKRLPFPAIVELAVPALLSLRGAVERVPAICELTRVRWRRNGSWRRGTWLVQ